MAAAGPVVLQTDVHCHECATKIRNAVGNLLGVERVWASPDTGLVVVAGTADPAALRRRIRRKMRRPVAILSDGSTPYAGPTTTPHWHYGAGDAPPSSMPPYGWGTAPPQHAYYSHPQRPPPPPPPPAAGYPYGGWASDPDPYGYGTRATVPTCSIL
ncbi:hypothetical protein VPH35_068660 [Triticum aestivum]